MGMSYLIFDYNKLMQDRGIGVYTRVYLHRKDGGESGYLWFKVEGITSM